MAGPEWELALYLEREEEPGPSLVEKQFEKV